MDARVGRGKRGVNGRRRPDVQAVEEFPRLRASREVET